MSRACSWKNFVHMPGIEVDSTHFYLNGLSPFDPSPDWFTGFYLFDTTDEITRNFFSNFTIRLYPWDLGTQDGEFYADIDAIDLDQPERVKRFTRDTVPNDIFLSADRRSIPYTAELQCELTICTIGSVPSSSECVRENWPPANGCDIMRYPGCDTQCDPELENPCNECKLPPGQVGPNPFYADCCASNTEPINGNCDGFDDGSGVSSLIHVLFTVCVRGTSLCPLIGSSPDLCAYWIRLSVAVLFV